VQELFVEDDNDLFLFEGIQTLYPEIDALLREYPYFGMFINVQSSLVANGIRFEPNRIRLLRRLVRDYYRRSSSPEFTFFLWNSVRENEERNIFPNATRCDATMDSLMGYELSMLRPYLEHILPTLPSVSKNHATAEQILRELQGIQPLSEQLLSHDSLYREFVGKAHVQQ
jgi:uridine kinase